MPFVKGQPKIGGRQKGTPNKERRDLHALCKEKGIDPFETLLELCQHREPSIKLQASKEACKYLYPQIRTIEHKGDPDSPIKTAVESSRVTEMLREFQSLITMKESEQASQEASAPNPSPKS